MAQALQDVRKQVAVILADREYPASPGPLCGYRDFLEICPEGKGFVESHPGELQQEPPLEQSLLNDSAQAHPVLLTGQTMPVRSESTSRVSIGSGRATRRDGWDETGQRGEEAKGVKSCNLVVDVSTTPQLLSPVGAETSDLLRVHMSL
jgi:hypothetical protein